MLDDKLDTTVKERCQISLLRSPKYILFYRDIQNAILKLGLFFFKLYSTYLKTY